MWRRIYELGIVPVELPNPKITMKKDTNESYSATHNQRPSHETVINYVYSDEVYNTPSLPDSPCGLTNNRFDSKTEFSPEAEELRYVYNP